MDASAERHRRSKLLDTILWEQTNKAELARSMDEHNRTGGAHGRSLTGGLSPSVVAAIEAEEANVFPDWLTDRSDFKAITHEPLAETVIRREAAEKYLRDAKHVDPKRHARYFQGPLRTHNLRRKGELYGTFQDRHTITMETIGAHAMGGEGNMHRHAAALVGGGDGVLKQAASTTSVSTYGGTLRRVGGDSKSKAHILDEDEAAREEEERAKILAVLEVRGARSGRHANRCDVARTPSRCRWSSVQSFACHGRHVLHVQYINAFVWEGGGDPQHLWSGWWSKAEDKPSTTPYRCRCLRWSLAQLVFAALRGVLAFVTPDFTHFISFNGNGAAARACGAVFLALALPKRLLPLHCAVDAISCHDVPFPPFLANPPPPSDRALHDVWQYFSVALIAPSS